MIKSFIGFLLTALILFSASIPARSLADEAVKPVATLIPFGAVWRYSDAGIDLGTEWKNTGFDDSKWKKGPAELGYGFDSAATALETGPSITERHATYYFRHTFQVTAEQKAAASRIYLAVHRSGGFAGYLNGLSIVRDNLPPGADYDTILGIQHLSDTSQQPLLFALNPDFLKVGANLLAIEMRPPLRSTGNIAFDLSVVGVQESNAPIQRAVRAKPSAPPLKVGDKAEDFEIIHPDGRSARLKDHLGKPLVIQYWGTLCAPCIAAMPEIDRVMAQLRPQGVDELSLNIWGTQQDVARFLQKNGTKFPNLIFVSEPKSDRVRETVSSKRYDAGTPAYMFLDKQGKILAKVNDFSMLLPTIRAAGFKVD